MVTITGITAEIAKSTGEKRADGVSVPYTTIHFAFYRIDDGPIVDEALSVTRLFPDGWPRYSSKRRKVPNQEVLRLVCERAGDEWVWTKNRGVIKSDKELNARLETLTHTSPPVHQSDVIVDSYGRETLVPDIKRVDPFEIPGIGTIWPTYSRDGWGNVRFDSYQSDPITLESFHGFTGVFDLYRPPTDDQKLLMTEAAQRLCAAGSSLQEQATEHVLRNYEKVRNQFDDESCQEYGIPLSLDEHDVWDHVTLNRHVTFSVNVGDESPFLHPNSAYVVFEGSCTWEEEHGLLLSYLNGDRIVRVNQYDGHPTSAHASAQASLLDVIT